MATILTYTYLIVLVLAGGSLSTVVQAAISPEAAAAFSDPTVQSLINTNDTYPTSAKGEAILKCKAGNNNVQNSNFGTNSFSIVNTGNKRIAAVFIDSTDAMFSDVVFDNDGTGGDNVAKDLTYDSGATTVGAISISSYQYLWLKTRDSSFNPNASFNPNDLSNVNNLFVNSVANVGSGAAKAGGGFRGELLLFNDFTSTEQVTFSGDMDPNSLAGLAKSSIDLGANWDVGGVSGAEMIGSVVTVLFGDGTFAVSTMASDGSQAGSVAVLRELGLPESIPLLSVNGISAGGSGTYHTNPTVVVSSDPGNMVRISMVKGFDAVTNTATVANGAITIDALVAARLAAQYPEFPVNNAYSWQHTTATIPSDGFLDVSSQFNVGTENMAIAWTAVVIDGAGQPISETADPIRLVSSCPYVGPNYDIGTLRLNNILSIGSPCGNNVRVSLNISHAGTLESSGSGLDFLKVFYTIGSSSEVNWLNIAGSQYNNQYQIDLNTNGAMLSLRIEGKTTQSSEKYFIRDLKVAAPAPAPAPAPIPAPVTPPVTPPLTPPVAPPVAPPVTPPVPPPVTPSVTPLVAAPVSVLPPVSPAGWIFTLFNAATDLPIGSVTNGSVINLAAAGTSLSIVATPPVTGVGSVVFTYDGIVIRTENTAPYSVAADSALLNGNFDYAPWTPTPTVGTHSLKVTAYSAMKGRGTVLSTSTISFTVQ